MVALERSHRVLFASVRPCRLYQLFGTLFVLFTEESTCLSVCLSVPGNGKYYIGPEGVVSSCTLLYVCCLHSSTGVQHRL